jgi:hypothetical protein
LLAKRDHFLPLAQIPTRAKAGDYIYLIYRGRITARARIHALEAVKRGIGYMPELPPLYPDMTVQDYLSFV